MDTNFIEDHELAGCDVNQREFAKAIGVTEGAITKAVKTGRLTPPVKKNGRRGNFFNFSIAAREWYENTDPKNTSRAEQQIRATVGDGEPPDNSKYSPSSVVENAHYQESRAKREAYEADMARMKHRQMEGSLIEASAVRMKIFSVAREIRDAMLNIPNRVAAELSVEDDEQKIHIALMREINDALSDVADRLSAGLDEAVELSNAE